MPTKVRVASFNVENLFSRAKVLNLGDPTVGEAALKRIAALDQLLRKTNYTAAIKSQIVAAYQEVKTYIDVRENRGRLFNQSKTQVVANGVAD